MNFFRFSFSLTCATLLLAQVPTFAQATSVPSDNATARSLAPSDTPSATSVSSQDVATSVSNASLAQRRSAFLKKAPSVALRGASTPRRFGAPNAPLRVVATRASAAPLQTSNSVAAPVSTPKLAQPIRLAALPKISAAPAVSENVARGFADLTGKAAARETAHAAALSSTRNANLSPEKRVNSTANALSPQPKLVGLPQTSSASANGVAFANGASSAKAVVGSTAIASAKSANSNAKNTASAVKKVDVAPRRAPAVLSSRHKDRILLAQLEADLMRAGRGLDKADATLSRGQVQLQKVGATLRTAMMDAGDDAKGLHPFVRVAMRYAGTPYVWGGESRNGFDCSGFIIVVMRDLGYRALPHSAAEQFNYGTPIAQALLKPGDIVFFKNTYKPGVSHVGIYLGRRRFINAAGTGKGTIVSSLDEPKWMAHYAGARRLIKS